MYLYVPQDAGMYLVIHLQIVVAFFMKMPYFFSIGRTSKDRRNILFIYPFTEYRQQFKGRWSAYLFRNQGRESNVQEVTDWDNNEDSWYGKEPFFDQAPQQQEHSKSTQHSASGAMIKCKLSEKQFTC